MTDKELIEAVEAIKLEYDEDVVKDYQIVPLGNMNTGEQTGCAVILHLSGKYDYDEELITNWRRRLHAYDFYVNCKHNRLCMTFRIHFTTE